MVTFANAAADAGSLSDPETSVSSMGSGSPAVVLGRKEVTNGEEIVTELGVVAPVAVV